MIRNVRRIFAGIRMFSTEKAAPITTPNKGGRAISIGNIVEYKDFTGGLYLGVVKEISNFFSTQTSDRIKVKVFNKDKTSSSVDSFFLKFHSPFLPEDQVNRSNDKLFDEMGNFYQEAKNILGREFDKIEKTVSQMCPEDSVGYRRLIYEEDLTRAVFGAAYTPRQLYAIHLYLHSYADKFGKDSAYSAGGKHAVYFLRSIEDCELAKKAKCLIEKSNTFGNAFKEDVKQCLKEDTSLEVRPDNEIFVACLIKAATCGWQDFDGNPFHQIVTSLLNGVAPLSSYKDVARLVTCLGLETGKGSLLPVDPALSQSGLDLKIHPRVNTESKNKIVQPLDGSDQLEGEISFGEESDPAIAIDSKSTIEVDDAISMSKDGEWIHVHVAHPSRLIAANSPLDLEAQSKALTLYTTRQKYSMLPWSVARMATLDPSNPLNQVMTFSAKLDSSGDIADFAVEIGVLKHLKRMTYEEADESIKTSNQFSRQLDLLSKHQKYRQSNGALSFSLPKGEVYEVDGKLVFTTSNPNDTPSHFLVSESMILAGRVAALYSQQKAIPVPFRYHENPAEGGNEETIELIERLKIEGDDAPLFTKLSLMSRMTSSAVDLQPRYHWAMGLKEYSKSTSPLRRYLDLLTHRQIRSTLLSSHKTQSCDELRQIIQPVFRHELYLKRLARASDRYWTLKYLQQELSTLSSQNEPFNVTVLPLDYNQFNSTTHLYIPQFALRTFDQVAGGSTMKVGVPCSLEILYVDPLRQLVRFALPE